MIKSELQQVCENKGITITSTHLYLDWDDPKFPRDKWSSTIHYQGRSATFEFFTGIGHRVAGPGWKAEGRNKWASLAGHVALGVTEAINVGALVLKRQRTNGGAKVVGPSVADVLSCILMDARACETTFDDWCSDFGADNDSLKALNTYLACQRNGSKVRNLLGCALVEELQNEEH